MTEDEKWQEIRLIRLALEKLAKNQEDVVSALLREILKFDISSSGYKGKVITDLINKSKDKTN